MKRVVLALAIALGLASFGIMAFASIPASDGTVHACYSNASIQGVHTIGIIDSSGVCPTGTTALNWNQTGPAGAQGPQGPQGPTGPQGPAGPSGQQRPQGAPKSAIG